MATTGFTPPNSPVGDGPVVRGFSITKSDTTVFAPTRYIFVGGTGALAVVLAGDDTVLTLSAIPAGTMLPLCAIKVMAATTATLLVGLY